MKHVFRKPLSDFLSQIFKKSFRIKNSCAHSAHKHVPEKQELQRLLLAYYITIACDKKEYF